MIGEDSVAASELAVRRACDELSRRLRSGLACEAEEFLAADPTIGSDTDAVLELLYTEFIVREQLGERPRPQEWLDRFPRCARSWRSSSRFTRWWSMSRRCGPACRGRMAGR